MVLRVSAHLFFVSDLKKHLEQPSESKIPMSFLHIKRHYFFIFEIVQDSKFDIHSLGKKNKKNKQALSCMAIWQFDSAMLPFSKIFH